MYNYGIIICLKDSINRLSLRKRTKSLISNLHIQYETRHPLNPTTGCFNSHIKALKKAIEIMEKTTSIPYIIICEEDIEIDCKSKYFINIIKALIDYNINSNYILHLGGLPTFTENFINIIKNYKSTYLIKSRVYLGTCYVVNLKVAKQLLYKLNKSSNCIHCDAIFANSGINQMLVKGNLVNQLNVYKSYNTFVHNFLGTKYLTNIFLKLNKLSILFIQDNIIILLLIYLCYKKYKYILLLEIFIKMIDIIKKIIIHEKYNKYLNKNVFTFLELFKLFRLFTIYCLIKKQFFKI